MGAPAKCEFLKNGMNVVDVLSILPFFIELFMTEEHVLLIMMKNSNIPPYTTHILDKPCTKLNKTDVHTSNLAPYNAQFCIVRHFLTHE